MDSNQVSLTRMMLNIATPSGQGISFSRGEILQGSVQEVRADGLVMMFLKGRLIEAATEVMVKPGQQLFLMVDDFRDGKTYLKVLNSERIEKLENANISANLKSMGIPVKEETVLFARKLLQHNLPVTPQNLNEMQKGVNILGVSNPSSLEIVTLALSRGLPFSQQVLNALLQFTDPGSDISKLLRNLIQNLNQLSRYEGSAINQPANNRTSKQSGGERPVGVGVAIPQSGDERQSGTVNRLVAENPSQLVMAERTTGGLIANSESLSFGGDKISNLSTGVKTDGDMFKFLALIRPFLDILQIDLNNNPGAIRENLQNLLQSEKELIRFLILLQDMIKGGEPGSKLPLLSELLNRIEGMEREISGQRIFNYIGRMPDSNFNYYYFSFPVKINDEYRLCQMRVNREAGNKLLKEQDNIKFIVSLDTANMGMVLFHVNWNKNKTLTLQGVVESNEVMHYFNKHISRLIEGLNQLGYTVNNLGVRMVQKDEEMDKLRPVMEEVPMKFRPFSIDVTV